MEADLIITGGVITTSSGEQRVGLAINDGIIVAIANDAALPSARETIDARGLHILPGLIDTHVHIRDPGRTEREDFQTGTAAAAAGGITTILEMPIAIPPVSTAAALSARVAAARERSYVDFGFYGGAAGDNLDDIEPLAEAGAIAFKSFRIPAPPGREREFVGLSCPDSGDYFRALERIASTGLVSAVHAEDAQILQRISRDRQANELNPVLTQANERPEIVETASVAQSLALAKATGARIQIVHCSTPTSVDLITQARADGVAATAETCPHYLFLTEAELEKHGPFARINPPLRSAETVDAIWERISRREIDVIGTDHAPFLAHEKEAYWNDLSKAPPGAPGLEAMLPLMLTAVNLGRITLKEMVVLTSENAARIFGLYPKKGVIRVGSEADFVLVDLEYSGKIDTSQWHSKSRETARIWNSYPVRGKVVATYVRGRLIVRNNTIAASPGWGRFISPV